MNTEGVPFHSPASRRFAAHAGLVAQSVANEPQRGFTRRVQSRWDWKTILMF